MLPLSLSHAVETRSSPAKVHPIVAVSNPLPNPSEAVPERVRIYVLIGGCTFGGDGRNRTAVQHAFTTKGLQQFFSTY